MTASAARDVRETAFSLDVPPVEGATTVIDGEAFTCIRNHDGMSPFFMTVVSDADHWMFLSSNGGLTAGRVSAAHALFPYYTEDKIHDLAEVTGPRTVCRVQQDGGTVPWEPFSDRYRGLHRVRRNLYKSGTGNAVIFEEENLDLGLAFRYAWRLSDQFGFVRESRLENRSRRATRVELLDGLQNLLPAGVHPDFQLFFSNLGDAYKKNELEAGTLGIFSYSSVPGDKAEPMESLRANTCFCVGLDAPTVLISSKQLDAFRAGRGVREERDVRGARGAYFVRAAFDLTPGASQTWSLVADVDQGPADVVKRIHQLGEKDLAARIASDVREGTRRLKRIVGSADGLQRTGDAPGSSHHFAACLFNVMRGGTFQDGYAIARDDLADVIARFNREVHAAHGDWLQTLPASIGLARLRALVAARGDVHLERIVTEYLPLSFSRRHGDPSRPWNAFSIELKDAGGKRRLAYQGNWRDIFQNWEALALSFPEFTDGFLCKFLNTTTADGYNPYRIGKLGFDWEKPSPHDPWAHIGYWGDHQLIYLLRLMEASRRYDPARLATWLTKDAFVYADVPYDIKPYEDLIADPRHSIAYSAARETAIRQRSADLGIDGQYVADARGRIHTVNFAEKVLVPLLAKVANLVPGGGIWLNTQRPEWNDANNALAGFGLSMVTLYHARRYAAFVKVLLDAAPERIALSSETATWFGETLAALEAFRARAGGAEPRRLVEPLGRAAAAFRKRLYERSFSGERSLVATAELRRFLDLVLAEADAAVRIGRRDDGLYHSYNVFDPATMQVRPLHEMLEGQVAVLSSGALDADEAIRVLEALRRSRMYRADQHSYMLYPDRDLPRFTARNLIPGEKAARIPLLVSLIEEGNRALVEKDVHGDLHFQGDLKNAGDVDAVLASLAAAGRQEAVARDREAIVRLFEDVFDHRSFTGRSGTFFAYEGLGSIYWHMVSKLLLAVQENFFAAVDAGLVAQARRLREIYYDVRGGLGLNKTPAAYGAFPADPYSHTPAGAGAKQPGMTGQVKEQVLARAGELGLRVSDGALVIQPALLRRSEFVDEACDFELVNVDGEAETIALVPGTLGFTWCQVPVVYHLAEEARVDLTFRDGSRSSFADLTIERAVCADVFQRTGKVRRIDVFIPGRALS